MTITTLILILTFILSISISFILGRKSVMKKAKKLKKRAKRTKKAKAKVTHGNAETLYERAVSDQKKGRKAKKTWKADLSAFDAETLKAYQDAMKADNSVLPSYDQANVGHQPELNLDPDAYIQNLAKEALETSKDIKEMTDKK